MNEYKLSNSKYEFLCHLAYRFSTVINLYLVLVALKFIFALNFISLGLLINYFRQK